MVVTEMMVVTPPTIRVQNAELLTERVSVWELFRGQPHVNFAGYMVVTALVLLVVLTAANADVMAIAWLVHSVEIRDVTENVPQSEPKYLTYYEPIVIINHIVHRGNRRGEQPSHSPTAKQPTRQPK